MIFDLDMSLKYRVSSYQIIFITRANKLIKPVYHDFRSIKGFARKIGTFGEVSLTSGTENYK